MTDTGDIEERPGFAGALPSVGGLGAVEASISIKRLGGPSRPPMSLEIQTFLDGKEIALLATVQADGAPLAMPMWFLHDPASLTMISEASAQKVRNLRRDPRVCVVAEAGGGGADIRGVTVQGRAEFLADGPERRALVERFHQKYPRLNDLWRGHAMPPDRVMFRIVPERARSWGL